MWRSRRYEPPRRELLQIDFSVPIFVDGATLLTGVDSKVLTLSDLSGAKIAVIPGTTTETALKRALEALRITQSPRTPL